MVVCSSMTAPGLPAVKRRKRNLRSGTISGQHLADDLPVNIGETEVAALEAEGQPGVLEAQQMQEGGVDVVDMTTVLYGIEAEFVGLAHGAAGLHAAAGKPHRERVDMMVASRRVAVSPIGVRPNSPPQMTSVSSSK